MEEKIDVRYTFVLMLAICDPTGHVIGTDVAIARRLNMGVEQFQQCVEILMRPDKDSNSKEEDGRRVIPSTGERGYKLVNYLTYREMKDEEHRRSYMRDYMQNYREKKAKLAPVKNGKQRLTQEEEEEEVNKKPAGGEPAALKGGEKKEPTEYTKLVEDWMAYYLKRNGVKYPYGGRDGKAAKLLLAHFKTLEATKNFIKDVHKRAKDGYPFSNSDTLYEIANNIGKLQAKLAEVKGLQNGQSEPPDFMAEWSPWLKANGHEFREYQFAPEFLKSDFHKDRKAAKA